MTAKALQPSDFQTLLAGLTGRVAVAVSGGPDSMALAWGAKAAGLDVTALIVEHGLRVESAQEAQTVAERLQAMGIPAHILPWEHGAITSRVHVRARQARYALLLQACRQMGLETLLFAHHRDDQAETILMRFAKGSGLAGLAGMGAESEQDGIRLLRPLLSVAKERLIATCEAAGVSFVTDPSNLSDHYARGRLRRVQELLSQEGFTAQRMTDFGVRAGEAAQAIDFYAKKHLQTHARLTEGGAITLETDGLADLPQAVRLQLLSLCLMSLKRGDYPPERTGLLGAMAYVCGESEAASHTFYGCIAQKGQGRVLLLREPDAVRDVGKGDGLWDGRWQIVGAGEGEIRALGLQTHEVLDSLAPELRRKVPQGRVRATLPSLWKGGQLVAIPDLFAGKKDVFSATFLPPLWL